jgi:phosphonate transport system ATP-binding protein
MIQFNHVSKTYPGGVKALQDVNLTIQDGEFVAIIGLSGAGKSTLLRSINKMQSITEGEILIDGVPISQLKGKALRQVRSQIGMIFQSFNLVKRMSVFNNVLTGRIAFNSTFKTLFGWFSKKDQVTALESLQTMGILDKAFVRADKLSGGQQQRVALARALTQQPKLILADEPVASLDPLTTVQVMDDFLKINQQLGMTIVANMHHVDLALKYATRVIGIKAGKIVFDGPKSDVNEAVLTTIYGRGLKHDEVIGNRSK